MRNKPLESLECPLGIRLEEELIKSGEGYWPMPTED